VSSDCHILPALICLWCLCLQVISLSLVQVLKCSENATEPHSRQSVQSGQGMIVQPLCNTAQLDSSTALPLPFIVGARSRVDTMHVPLQLNSFRELMSGPGAAAEPQPGPITIYLRAQGQHSSFVCAYVLVLTVVCVALGLYLLAAALDQAFARPRPLNPSAINSCAGGHRVRLFGCTCTACQAAALQYPPQAAAAAIQQQHANKRGCHIHSNWLLQCT
jgi:hypothetical protein